MSISNDWFTSTKEQILQKYFLGDTVKQAKNGVYLVAHTDTVHGVLPTDADILDNNGYLCAPHNGLGADDRCGCYITHTLAQQFPDCGYVISNDEEDHDPTLYANPPALESPKFFLSFDRKGIREYVNYGHRSKIMDGYLRTRCFSESKGTYSTCALMSEIYRVPCINVCFGGGDFHRLTEYLNVNILKMLMPVYGDIIKFAENNELDYTYTPPTPKMPKIPRMPKKGKKPKKSVRQQTLEDCEFALYSSSHRTREERIRLIAAIERAKCDIWVSTLNNKFICPACGRTKIIHSDTPFIRCSDCGSFVESSNLAEETMLKPKEKSVFSDIRIKLVMSGEVL